MIQYDLQTGFRLRIELVISNFIEISDQTVKFIFEYNKGPMLTVVHFRLKSNSTIPKLLSNQI